MRRFLFLALLLSPFVAFGQETPSEGVILEPALQKIYVAATGLREPVQKIKIKNTTALEQHFVLQSIEFTNIDKYGGNIFLGQSLAGGDFESASWMKLETEEIFLIPGETKEIAVELQNEETLAPGAHYGAVLFRAVRPGENGSEQVYLRQIAASLVYLSKEAGTEKKLSLKKVNYFSHFPYIVDTAVGTFVNEGNDFLEPRGVVILLDIFGRERARAILNESSKNLFPGQEREMEAKFQKVNYFLPGKYTLLVQYRFGDEEYQTKTLDVWYFDPLWPLGIVFFLSLAFYLGNASLQKRKNR